MDALLSTQTLLLPAPHSTTAVLTQLCSIRVSEQYRHKTHGMVIVKGSFFTFVRAV